MAMISSRASTITESSTSVRRAAWTSQSTDLYSTQRVCVSGPVRTFQARGLSSEPGAGKVWDSVWSPLLSCQ